MGPLTANLLSPSLACRIGEPALEGALVDDAQEREGCRDERVIDQVHLGQPRCGEPVEFTAAHRPEPFWAVRFVLAVGPAADEQKPAPCDSSGDRGDRGRAVRAGQRLDGIDLDDQAEPAPPLTRRVQHVGDPVTDRRPREPLLATGDRCRRDIEGGHRVSPASQFPSVVPEPAADHQRLLSCRVPCGRFSGQASPLRRCSTRGEVYEVRPPGTGSRKAGSARSRDQPYGRMFQSC